MALNIGSTPDMIQKFSNCCWLNADISEFKESSPGVFHWAPGADAGECVFQVLDADGNIVSEPEVCVDTALEVVKTADVSDISDALPGDIIIYTIVVTNTGSATVFGVRGTDPLISLAGSVVDLPPGGSVTYTGSYTLTQTDIDAGQVSNTASAIGNDGIEGSGVPVVCPSNEVTVTLSEGDPGNPSISLTKNGDASQLQNPPQVGNIITYTFTITNTGDVALNNVFVSDPDVTLVGSPITLPVGASDSTTFTAAYAITQADIDASFKGNVATVFGTSQGVTVSDSDSFDCPLISNDICEPMFDLPAVYVPDDDCELINNTCIFVAVEGDVIQLEGSCSPCEGVWQRLINGEWVDRDSPNGQLADKFVHQGTWRLSCGSGGCSDVFPIVVNCIDDVPSLPTTPYTINAVLDGIIFHSFSCCNSGDYFPQYWDPAIGGFRPTGLNNFPINGECQWTYTFNGVTETIDLNGSLWRICCPDGCSADDDLVDVITLNIIGCP